MSKLSKLTREDLFYTEEEALEWAEWERRSIEEEARNKGLSEGRTVGRIEGEEEKTKELILSMLNNGATLEFVSKVTNKTIEEIKNLKN